MAAENSWRSGWATVCVAEHGLQTVLLSGRSYIHTHDQQLLGTRYELLEPI